MFSFARYRAWLDRRSHWYIPGENAADAPAEEEPERPAVLARPAAPARPARSTPVPRPAPVPTPVPAPEHDEAEPGVIVIPAPDADAADILDELERS
jgi:hypothetical protein